MPSDLEIKTLRETAERIMTKNPVKYMPRVDAVLDDYKNGKVEKRAAIFQLALVTTDEFFGR